MTATLATLANWRTAPYNQWAFHHVRELIPSAEIASDPAGARPLPSEARDLGELRIEPDSGEPLTLERFLEETSTDAFAIVHRGRLICERYGNGMTPASQHILMSVSKSMLGLLILRLGLDPAQEITHWLPELEDTAYRGATLRHLLDMRTGVAFEEDYLATSGPIVAYRKSTGWNPLAPTDAPSDLHKYFSSLKKSEGPHGGRFHYISPNSDLLGWLVERATGRRYADLMSELLWRPIGAERSAYVTVDRLGAARAAGGMCTTVRDLARVGLWLCESAAPWIDDLERGGERAAWDAGSFAEYFPGLPMRYRGQWYAMDGESPLLFAVGIHGQNLFVDRRNRLVIAKFSSQAQPLDAARIGLTTRAVSQLRKLLQ